MRTRSWFLWPGVLALLLAGLTGCSTKVYVSDFNATKSAGELVDGIPFRSKERYELVLHRLVNNRYEAVEANETVATLANQEQLYLLKMRGSTLADSTVVVTMNADNTLSSVSVDSKSKGEEVLSELSTQAKAVSDAKSAREAAEKSGLTAGEDARLSALDAKKDAVLAQLALDTLPESTTQKDRTAAELVLQRAKLVANQKARRAELPLPYPEAGL